MNKSLTDSRDDAQNGVVRDGLRVLVVDDDDLNQQLLKMVLSKDGHHVSVSYDGYDAVKMLEVDHYDLVFLDITIPRVSGFEVCEHIRKGDFPNAKTSIVALTALPSRDERLQDFLERKMFNGCIHKPFDRAQISEILSAASNQKEFHVVFTEKDLSAIEALTLNYQKALVIFDNDITAYKKLLKEFLDGVPQRIADIQVTRNVADWKKLAVLGHNLTGVARNFGAEKLSKLAEELDNASTETSAKLVDNAIAEIKEELPKLQQAYIHFDNIEQNN